MLNTSLIRILFLILLSLGIAFGIRHFMDAKKGIGIPLTSFSMGSNKIILVYINPKTSESIIIQHNFTTNTTKDLSRHTLFAKCFPLYYNDSLLMGFYKMEKNDKYAVLHLKNQSVKWIFDEEKDSLIPNLNSIQYQSHLDANNYDPEKLPTTLVTDPEFKGAQYVKDNHGSEIMYNGKPLIAVYTQKVYKDYVNRFSRINKWRMADMISRKCFVGLYDEKNRRFLWMYEQALDNESFYKMMLYYGVFPLDSNRILLVNNNNTEVLHLDSGEVLPQSIIN